MISFCLGFFIALYPFSLQTLPFGLLCVLAAVVIAVGSRARILSLRRALLIAVAVYVIATLISPGCVDLSEYTRQNVCRHNLKHIMFALHNYHERNGCFPPAYVADESGRPMHSWRVLILPDLDKLGVYKRYRMDEPWDGPNNRQLLGIPMPIYRCPEQPFSGTPLTSYMAVVGPTTAWPGSNSTKAEDFRDGTGNTLMVVEVANSGTHWMEPRDLDYSTMPMSVNPKTGLGISSLHREPSWNRRLLGAAVARADGSVYFLPTNTPVEELRALLTIAGGEKTDQQESGK